MDMELPKIIDTALKETTCTNNWCALKDSVKWNGPARQGAVLTTCGSYLPLNAQQGKYRIQHDEKND
jgi:hypothetical protein